MKTDEVRALDIEWLSNSWRFANAVDIEETEVVLGLVLAYQPLWGATTFDGDVCGMLLIEEIDTAQWWKVSLDKGALADAVDMAINTARIMAGLHPGSPQFVIAIRYLGKNDVKGYKQYKVTAGRLGK